MDAVQMVVTKIKTLLKNMFRRKQAADIEKQEGDMKPQEDKEDEGPYGAKLLLTVFLIYMFLGALLCPSWERWSFFESLYFW